MDHADIAERVATELAAHFTTQQLAEALVARIEDDLSGEDLKPTLDRALVKPLLTPDWIKRGGLYVVENDERTQHYLVIRIGPQVMKDSEVRPGHVVVAGPYVGHPISVKHETYRLVKLSDMLAIIEHEALDPLIQSMVDVAMDAYDD